MNTPVPLGKQLHFCGCEEHGSFNPCATHLRTFHKDKVLLALLQFKVFKYIPTYQ